MNIVDQIIKIIRRDQEEQIFSAEVVVVNGNRVKIRRTGFPTDNQEYPTLRLGSGVGYDVGDIVLVVRSGRGSYVVLGEIQR